jgi:hypothetical protein
MTRGLNLNPGDLEKWARDSEIDADEDLSLFKKAR